MIVHNHSNVAIGFGSVVISPGVTTELPDAARKHPRVIALIEQGILSIAEEKTPAKTATDK